MSLFICTALPLEKRAQEKARSKEPIQPTESSDRKCIVETLTSMIA
jgi:hypothetical protein